MALGLQIALVFVAGIGGGIFMGEIIGERLGSRPVGIIAGVLCGISLAFLSVYRLLKKEKNI